MRVFSVHCISELTGGNYGNSLSRIFGKNFVKVTVLLSKLLKSWFDEIFFWWEKISRFSTFSQCGKLLRNTITLKNFREINSLVTSSVKMLIWRKNVDFPVKIVIVFLTTFPHSALWNYEFLHFYDNNFVKAEVSKELFSRNMVSVKHSVVISKISPHDYLAKIPSKYFFH